MAVKIGDLIEAVNDPIKLQAVERNREFIRLVRDETLALMTKYGTRAGIPKGRYHDIPTGISSYYGYIGREITLETFFTIIDHLRTLVRLQIIGLDDSFPIRSIDWNTGSGAWININNYAEQERLNRLGYPTRGQFTPTDRPLEKFFDYMSFTGTDATVLAIMGDVVTTIRNLSGISWSLHRPKPAVRKLGKTNATARARGTRTIAGTLIFTETDEDPLLPLYPSAIVPKDMEYISGKTQYHQPTILPDQLPPFDLIIVWQNEYGNAKQMTIFGLDIVDDGSSRQDRDMQDECVVQYTAIDIDKPKRVEVGPDGTIDPLSITSGDLSAYWQRRWMAAHAAGNHEDPYEQTSEYYEQIDSGLQARPDFVETVNRPNTPTINPGNANGVSIARPTTNVNSSSTIRSQNSQGNIANQTMSNDRRSQLTSSAGATISGGQRIDPVNGEIISDPFSGGTPITPQLTLRVQVRDADEIQAAESAS